MTLGLQLHVLHASAERDFRKLGLDDLLAQGQRQGARTVALVAMPPSIGRAGADACTTALSQLAALAAQYALPAMFAFRTTPLPARFNEAEARTPRMELPYKAQCAKAISS
jgi:hypothetical protein